MPPKHLLFNNQSESKPSKLQLFPILGDQEFGYSQKNSNKQKEKVAEI